MNVQPSDRILGRLRIDPTGSWAYIDSMDRHRLMDPNRLIIGFYAVLIGAFLLAAVTAAVFVLFVGWVEFFAPDWL